MNSIGSITLAFLFLIQTMSPNMDLCCELQKLPTLYEHYTEHLEHDGTTMVDFLSLHYGGDEMSLKHHHEDEHHDELPYSGNHQCHHAPVCFTLEHSFSITMLGVNETINCSQYSFSLISAFPRALFQPPRV